MMRDLDKDIYEPTFNSVLCSISTFSRVAVGLYIKRAIISAAAYPSIPQDQIGSGLPV